MILPSSFVALALASLAAAASAPARRAPDLVLPLSVALVQSNLDRLDDYLLDHWTPAAVADAFRPSAEAVEAVRAWLTADGTVDALLGTEYYVYEHADGSAHIACKDGYSLPAHVSKHVDLVTPTLHFAKPIKHEKFGNAINPLIGAAQKHVPTDLSTCDELITPDCLRALYNFEYKILAANKNALGIVEYSPNILLPSDLDVFFGNFSPASDPNLIGEANLDVQTAMGLLGHRQQVKLYQVGDVTGLESFNNFLDALDGSFCAGDDPEFDATYPNDQPGGFTGPEACGSAPTTFVISTSYGYQEADLTPAYEQRQCAEYGKLALTGATFVYSSGDSGVEGFDGSCLNDAGEQVQGGTRFNPTFPGGCPYVTSVGATQVVPGNSVRDPESAVFQRFPSGGGFSNVFPVPSFQKAAVANYLAHHVPSLPAGVFNASGRAFPDVSANGLNYSIALLGHLRPISGTSASAPLFATLLTAVNDARFALGKRPVGWINPAIYAHPEMFNDITNGTNPGCDTDGFAASAGWDP
ncbi:subtilisin-like protein [Epithele typhae]|uniref:subtilisin-like protein n=1 Tax=Epithele typhae TaxID=378194 RepID=UPI0020072953|nr:subtilisin-like protein [Epithele typhae]KAH9912155.1 subtilisin-like protein [Epithele typhae]